jgi:hypothetical protein
MPSLKRLIGPYVLAIASLYRDHQTMPVRVSPFLDFFLFSFGFLFVFFGFLQFCILGKQ